MFVLLFESDFDLFGASAKPCIMVAQRNISVDLHFPSIKSALFIDRGLKIFCNGSGFLGRFPGRVSLLHTPWKDYGQKVTEVYRKTSSKHRFWIPLGNKTGKIRSRCFPARKQAGTNQNASRCAIPAGGSQNVLRYAIPISTSQGRFCHRWCSQLKKPLVGIFARGDVL